MTNSHIVFSLTSLPIQSTYMYSFFIYYSWCSTRKVFTFMLLFCIYSQVFFTIQNPNSVRGIGQLNVNGWVVIVTLQEGKAKPVLPGKPCPAGGSGPWVVYGKGHERQGAAKSQVAQSDLAAATARQGGDGPSQLIHSCLDSLLIFPEPVRTPSIPFGAAR